MLAFVASIHAFLLLSVEATFARRWAKVWILAPSARMTPA
jgi:hypothetical protein